MQPTSPEIWKLWQDWLLSGKRLPPAGPPSPDDEPLGCFYGHTYDFKPVAIWVAPSGKWRCLVERRPQDPARVWQQLTYKRKPGTPTTYEAYMAKLDGIPFAQEAAKAEEQARLTPEGIGHNLPPTPLPDDPGGLLNEVDGLDVIISREAKAPDIMQERGFLRMSKLADRIAEIEAHTEELFRVEKAPWLSGGKVIDDKWRDVRSAANKLKTRAKNYTMLYHKEQEKLAKLEALRHPAIPMVKPKPPPGGTVMKTRHVGKIVDLKAFAIYCAELDEEAHPTFRATLGAIATKLIAKGEKNIPGVVVEIIQQAV